MDHPVVNIRQGSVRGAKINSEVGGSFLLFRGIPYAEPPIGDLRFKDPQNVKPWTGVRDALEEGPQCMQAGSSNRKGETSEDCLYLNVATTSLEGSRAVMVWIHGGAFLWGNGGSDFYGPDYLMKKDIVFVSFNYRLGIFGFLSLDHEAAPGNMGLKDQVAALKWVKQNIAQFGGDPNNVTIFGESAGGACVHYLLLSPLAKGLFHKAIAQSGVALCPWANILKPVEIAHRLVAHLGQEITDPHEVLKFLRTVPAQKLVEAQANVLTPAEKASVILPFVPTVDGKSGEPFLPRSVRELATESRDVPLLLGYNSHEGIVALSEFGDEVNENVEKMLSVSLQGFSPAKRSDSMKKLKRCYFGSETLTKDVTAEEYIRFTGDYLFVNGIHELVDFRANAKSPTYLYRFDHDSPNKLSLIYWLSDVKGAAHYDDIAYIFHSKLHRDLPYIEPNSIEQIISERFVRMWTDFAKTGNPTPEVDDLITAKWEPVTKGAKNYLNIGAELSAEVDPIDEFLRTWKRVLLNADEDQNLISK